MMNELIEVVCYTDPLCCWSWGMEPQWRRIQYEYRKNLVVRYCMSGLLESWNNHNDVINAASRPVQMGPLWAEAKHITGMEMNDRIWINNAPASSYPACLAVKCAGMQGTHAAAQMLRALREALMLHGQNIAHKKALHDVADKVEKYTDFDAALFCRQLSSKECIDLLRKDLQEVRYRQVKRSPSFAFTVNGKGVILTGYRPYSVLKETLELLGGNIEAYNIDETAYRSYWGKLTQRELLEITAGNVTATPQSP